MSNPMTPTEQDKELRERIGGLIREAHASGYILGTWAHPNIPGDNSIEPSNPEDITEQTLELITADRKRVALEARIKVITDIELFVIQEASTYMNSKYTHYQHQKDYSDGIADGKNNAYARLAQWLNQLKSQLEEV